MNAKLLQDGAAAYANWKREHAKKFTVGRGGFSTVWEVDSGGAGGDRRAVKEIMLHNAPAPAEQDTQRAVGGAIERPLVWELNLLGTVHHPNVVSLDYVMCCPRKKLLLFAQPLYDASLAEVLALASGGLSWTVRRSVATQMLRGLEAIHTLGLIHRDIKPGNVLLKCSGEAVLADAGWSRDITSSGDIAVDGNPGTLWYRAPESFTGGSGYGSSVDIWACGCCFVELTGRCPLFRVFLSDNQRSLSSVMGGPQNRLLLVCQTRLLGVPSESDWPAVRTHRWWDNIRALWNCPRAEVAAGEAASTEERNRRYHPRLPELLSPPAPHSAELVLSNLLRSGSQPPESSREDREETKSLLSLARDMLRWDPARRPIATNALEADWFTEHGEVVVPTPLPAPPSGTRWRPRAAGSAAAAPRAKRRRKAS
eukprot:TRINITY_DN15206_c0_g1_i1.p1 TRINITY_DN15206_c0_g1~~TRINITY_DN15206_c0_g1_i1.p1  ORF type:complete len:425 (+),score=98.78 TRINITY_DN15206_c0_g1_i1:72-1346(+)